MAMIWTASYETGVPLMDNQHKELFKHMDALTDKSKSGQILQSLEYLSQYIDKHFREEQDLHASCKYPQRDAHKKLHVEFVAAYRKLRSEFENSPGKEAIMSMRINRNAVEWLKNHIYGPDKTFAKYYFSLPGNVDPKAKLSAASPFTRRAAPEAAPAKSFGLPSLGHKTDPLSSADQEVLRRVPAQALADELVRRSDAATRGETSPRSVAGTGLTH
ncbi:MAG: hemerythrin family protein [Deltaproteobacteria bacterium]|nr:hemerythrin family protein [Deltaproteobacteria bacterium]